MKRLLLPLVLAAALLTRVDAGEKDKPKEPPPGFSSLFNGKDLSNWKNAEPGWTVEGDTIHYSGKGGKNLATGKNYKDFELWIDWKITEKGDSGIYLRGQPQVQIWDNEEGSGGLFNNKKGSMGQVPLYTGKERKDKKPGEWNTFYIKMIGSKVSVVLNNAIVVDNAIFIEGKAPADGTIELQVHGSPLWFRNVFVRELASDKK